MGSILGELERTVEPSSTYSLSKSAAAAVGRCLGTSVEKRLELAIKAQSKAAEARLFALERELIAERRRVPPVQAALDEALARYEVACRETDIQRAEVLANPEVALRFLTVTAAEEQAHRVYQINNAVNFDVAAPQAEIVTLAEILAAELAFLPATQEQDVLLRYRYYMLSYLDGLETPQLKLKKFVILCL